MHRYRCNNCKWDGPRTDIQEHKKVSGKPFPVCPQCGEYKEKVVDGDLKYNRSILTGYYKK